MRAVEVGFDVIGVDLDEERVASLASRTSYVEDVSDAMLTRAFESGRYKVCADYDCVTGFDFAVITVPTPLRESAPDLAFIKSSVESLALRLERGATVILESTTYPGTTEELVVPLLEKGSGLKAGADFHVGYSPERIDPGNDVWGFVETPKIVSGIDEESLDKVSAFYNSLVNSTVPVNSPREAELAKLIENTFRHVNIALMNELAVVSNRLGIDVWNAIDAAATKPFGFMKFTPGPGVGGHCLPVDPSYLSWTAKRSLGTGLRFIELANEVNDAMPDYVVNRAIRMLNERSLSIRGSRILALGLAYKSGTGDLRNAPSVKILKALEKMGARIAAVDAYVPTNSWPSWIRAALLTADEIDATDLVLILTDHGDQEARLLLDESVLVLDTRGSGTAANAENL